MSIPPASSAGRGPAARVPVVSVGNLAMGGRGKSPTVALVTRLLLEAGERPAVLSRGYARREPVEGALVVSDGVHRLADLDRSGDEPLMLARQLPGAAVIVSAIRAEAAALAEARYAVTVHVLDDGFQHRSLERDIDLVIVTRDDLVGRRLPFGRLRSPVSALRNADAVIVDGPLESERRRLLERAAGRADMPVFMLNRTLGRPWWLEPRDGEPGGAVVAVAGIARPERFTRALEAAGWTVAESIGFADHHPFSRRDLDRMRESLRRTSATVVLTTEKDAMRLLPHRPIGMPVAAVPLDVTVEPAGEFRRWLSARLAEVRACA